MLGETLDRRHDVDRPVAGAEVDSPLILDARRGLQAVPRERGRQRCVAGGERRRVDVRGARWTP